MKPIILVALCLSTLFFCGCNREKEVIKPQAQSSTGGGGGGGDNTPASAMVITRIEVINFLDLEWDPPATGNSLADIYTVVRDQDQRILFISSTYDNVALSQLPKGWDCNIRIPMSSVTGRWYVELYDYDVFDSDDSMCEASFDPRDYRMTRNPTIIITSRFCSFRIYASYE